MAMECGDTNDDGKTSRDKPGPSSSPPPTAPAVIHCTMEIAQVPYRYRMTVRDEGAAQSESKQSENSPHQSEITHHHKKSVPTQSVSWSSTGGDSIEIVEAKTENRKPSILSSLRSRFRVK